MIDIDRDCIGEILIRLERIEQQLGSANDNSARGDRFLGAPEVEARYGVAAMTIWRWLRDPALNFPKPVWIRTRRLWRESDLIAWERAQPARKSKKTLEMKDAAIA
jgi:predicted DNA-binding transcriptional regulator AlpA